jgi:hypothetical protein
VVSSSRPLRAVAKLLRLLVSAVVAVFLAAAAVGVVVVATFAPIYLLFAVLVPFFQTREVVGLIEQIPDAEVVRIDGDYDIGVTAVVAIRGGRKVEFRGLEPNAFVRPGRVYIHRIDDVAVHRIYEHPSGLRPVFQPGTVLFGSHSPEQSAIPIRNVADAIRKSDQLYTLLRDLPECSYGMFEHALERDICIQLGRSHD